MKSLAPLQQADRVERNATVWCVFGIFLLFLRIYGRVFFNIIALTVYVDH